MLGMSPSNNKIVVYACSTRVREKMNDLFVFLNVMVKLKRKEQSPENHGRWNMDDFTFNMALNIAHWKMPCYMIHAQSSIVHDCLKGTGGKLFQQLRSHSSNRSGHQNN